MADDADGGGVCLDPALEIECLGDEVVPFVLAGDAVGEADDA